MKTYVGLMLLALLALALVVQAQDGGSPKTSSLFQLSEVEILRGRVLSLEIERLNDLKTRCLPEPNRSLAEQLTALNKAIQDRFQQLKILGEKVLKEHNFNQAEYAVNWRDGKIEPKKAP